MIKLALKHWIYERCINVIFSFIQHNFTKPPMSMSPGTRFKCLKLWEMNEGQMTDRVEEIHDGRFGEPPNKFQHRVWIRPPNRSNTGEHGYTFYPEQFISMS